MWNFRELFCRNGLRHTVHLYGFSPVWMRLWTLSWVLVRKRCPQTLHTKGLLPSWSLKWTLSILDVVNRSPQTEHSYGLRPVWRSTCVVRTPDWLKLYPHSEHEYGLTLLWILRWTINWPCAWNTCRTPYTGKAWHQCADERDRADFSALEIAFRKTRSHNVYHRHRHASLCISQVHRWHSFALSSAAVMSQRMKSLNLRKQCATTGNTTKKEKWGKN